MGDAKNGIENKRRGRLVNAIEIHRKEDHDIDTKVTSYMLVAKKRDKIKIRD